MPYAITLLIYVFVKATYYMLHASALAFHNLLALIWRYPYAAKLICIAPLSLKLSGLLKYDCLGLYFPDLPWFWLVTEPNHSFCSWAWSWLLLHSLIMASGAKLNCGLSSQFRLNWTSGKVVFDLTLHSLTPSALKPHLDICCHSLIMARMQSLLLASV